MKGAAQYLTALHEAKRELAIVALDGVNYGLPVDIPDGELGNHLEHVYEALMLRRRTARG